MYSNFDKALEARREMMTRERVYPRWIEAKKIKADEAARRIAIMTEIATDYDELVRKDMGKAP
jgi:hypothetical protein